MDRNGDDAYSDIQSVYINNHMPIEIYPNPTDGHLTVIGQDIKEIQVFNRTGKMIRTKINPNINIDFSDFPPGLYVIRIHTAYGIFHRRIIKN